MPRRALPVLTSTGRPELQALEGSARNTATQLYQHITTLDATEIAYTPGSSTAWVSPAPRTVAEALDRLAAAGGVTPVP